jgi:hypothetical protein
VPDPSATTFNAIGGTASASVSTGPGCRWTTAVESGAESWLQIDTQGPSVGPGVVRFTLQPNRSFSGRTGSFVTLADSGEVLATYSVTERAAGCLYRVDPVASTLNWMGTYDGAGDSPISAKVFTEPADCQWTVSASVPWIRIVYGSASGRGDGTVYISLTEWYYGPVPRVGEVVVAGLSGVNPDARLAVTQTGQGR